MPALAEDVTLGIPAFLVIAVSRIGNLKGRAIAIVVHRLEAVALPTGRAKTTAAAQPLKMPGCSAPACDPASSAVFRQGRLLIQNVARKFMVA